MEALRSLTEGKNISYEQAQSIMEQMMEGKLTEAQIGALLTAMHMKGETADELAALASVMEKKALRLTLTDSIIVDTCGTGGDGQGSFNISTTAAFVVAGCNVTVAKHGNVGISSSCGSADVLKALGVNIERDPEDVEKCINDIGIGFLFAPLFHPAMKYVGPIRKQLGIRTIFNMLGPLINPAGATTQVIGVAKEEQVDIVANAVKKLKKSAMIVHGGGMDELTVSGSSTMCIVNDVITCQNISPHDVGLGLYDIAEVKGGSPEVNAKITIAVLSGEKGAARDIVLLNAAAALLMAEKSASMKEGVAIAAQSIDSGAAKKKLQELIAYA